MLLDTQFVVAQNHKIKLEVELKINTREESPSLILLSSENSPVPWILITLAAASGCTSHSGFKLNFDQKEAPAGDVSTWGERCWGISFYLFSCFNTSLIIAVSLLNSRTLHELASASWLQLPMDSENTIFTSPWHWNGQLPQLCQYFYISSLNTLYVNYLHQFRFLPGLQLTQVG